jgi:hypothetical protein
MKRLVHAPASPDCRLRAAGPRAGGAQHNCFVCARAFSWKDATPVTFPLPRHPAPSLRQLAFVRPPPVQLSLSDCGRLSREQRPTAEASLASFLSRHKSGHTWQHAEQTFAGGRVGTADTDPERPTTRVRQPGRGTHLGAQLPARGPSRLRTFAASASGGGDLTTRKSHARSSTRPHTCDARGTARGAGVGCRLGIGSL